jgi:hypothetical protein
MAASPIVAVYPLFRKILRKINPHWDGERLYQEARKINVAVYQHIIYNEFLPIILGEQAVKTLGLLPKPSGFNTCYSNKVDGRYSYLLIC